MFMPERKFAAGIPKLTAAQTRKAAATAGIAEEELGEGTKDVIPADVSFRLRELEQQNKVLTEDNEKLRQGATVTVVGKQPNKTMKPETPKVAFNNHPVSKKPEDKAGIDVPPPER